MVLIITHIPGPDPTDLVAMEKHKINIVHRPFDLRRAEIDVLQIEDVQAALNQVAGTSGLSAHQTMIVHFLQAALVRLGGVSMPPSPGTAVVFR